MEPGAGSPPMGYETVLRRVTSDYDARAVEVRTLFRFAGTGVWDPPYLVRTESAWYDVGDLDDAGEGDEVAGKGESRTTGYDTEAEAICAFEG